MEQKNETKPGESTGETKPAGSSIGEKIGKELVETQMVTRLHLESMASRKVKPVESGQEEIEKVLDECDDNISEALIVREVVLEHMQIEHQTKRRINNMMMCAFEEFANRDARKKDGDTLGNRLEEVAFRSMRRSWDWL